ncbi:hypothetical protein [Streptomyces sp. 2A115]|uniref:hypothetical protein n=1 Tax=Streptomyces sp. 2A115 TaxID=3457439 RepID=UPI003FD0033A
MSLGLLVLDTLLQLSGFVVALRWARAPSDCHRSVLPPCQWSRCLPNLKAGDPEPTVDEIYSGRQRIALERTNALEQFPKLKARIRRAGSR